MSHKNAETERRTPRAMPVETIITRFKSAQQKLEKEKQKKPRSKLVKKTPLELLSVDKKLSKPKKVYKKQNNDIKIDSKEYYPNRLKRKVLNARNFLAPKHNFKVICGTKSRSKRKLHTPHRDIQYIEKDPPAKQPELSIIDMIRIIEESDSLDDEDLLEILTCPSPVWWEEPPDGYIEEALFTEPRPEAERLSVKNQILQEELKKAAECVSQDEFNNNTDNTNITDSLEINIENKDKNFINKRCKLENILGDIKNMAKQKPTTKPRDTKNENKKYTNNMSKLKSDSESNNKNNSDVNDSKLVDIISEKSTENNIQKKSNIPKNLRNKSCDYKIKVKSKELLNNTYHSSKDDVIIIENENDIEFNKSVTKNNTNCTVLVSNKKQKSRESKKCINSNENKNNKQKFIENGKNINNDESRKTCDKNDKDDSDSDIEIIENIPEVKRKRDSDFTEEELTEFRNDDVLKHLENIDIPIEKSTKYESETRSSLNNLELFLTEEESNNNNKPMTEEYLDLSLLDDDEHNESEQNTNKDVENTEENIPTISKKDFLNNLELSYKTNEVTKINENNNDSNDKQIEKSKCDSKEYITVYKIFNDSDTNFTDAKVKRNINSYYKCKKNQRKKDTQGNKNESIVISETDKIKYCFKCSSIFDSDSCNYCLRKNLKRKSSDYACDQCGLNFVTKQEIIKHLIQHSVGNIDKL